MQSIDILVLSYTSLDELFMSRMLYMSLVCMLYHRVWSSENLEPDELYLRVCVFDIVFIWVVYAEHRQLSLVLHNYRWVIYVTCVVYVTCVYVISWSLTLREPIISWDCMARFRCSENRCLRGVDTDFWEVCKSTLDESDYQPEVDSSW